MNKYIYLKAITLFFIGSLYPMLNGIKDYAAQESIEVGLRQPATREALSIVAKTAEDLKTIAALAAQKLALSTASIDKNSEILTETIQDINKGIQITTEHLVQGISDTSTQLLEGIAQVSQTANQAASLIETTITNTINPIIRTTTICTSTIGLMCLFYGVYYLTDKIVEKYTVKLPNSIEKRLHRMNIHTTKEGRTRFYEDWNFFSTHACIGASLYVLGKGAWTLWRG